MLSIQLINRIDLILFGILYFRLLFIFVNYPLLENLAIPMVLKVLFTLLLSYAFFNPISDTLRRDLYLIGENNIHILFLIHMIFGLVIGYSVKVISEVFVSSGYIVSQTLGYGMVNLFDYSLKRSATPIEQLNAWVLSLLFVLSGGLKVLFKGAYDSFFKINYFNIKNINLNLENLINLTVSLIQSSLEIATPFIFSGIILIIILGVIARAIPQVNVLLMSFTLSIFFGVATFLFSYEEYFEKMLERYTNHLEVWFKLLS